MRAVKTSHGRGIEIMASSGVWNPSEIPENPTRFHFFLMGQSEAIGVIGEGRDQWRGRQKIALEREMRHSHSNQLQ